MDFMATLIYDGQCPRCTSFARWGQRWSQGRLRVLPLDAPGALDIHTDLSFSKALAAPQVVLSNGYLCEGAEAAAWVVGSRRGFGFVPLCYRFPLAKPFGQLLYWALKAPHKECPTCP
jgi:predicted DCC family thiol-disulfide oxidoreductase YuxK